MPKRKRSEDIDEILDEIEDEDLDESESVEYEDEEEEEEEEFEDPDEAPKAKKKRRKSSAKKQEREGVGTAEVADAAGISARQLRMLLRAEGIEKPEGEGRYTWSSLNHPQVKKILKRVSEGAVENAQKERLDKVKKRKKGGKKKARARR